MVFLTFSHQNDIFFWLVFIVIEKLRFYCVLILFEFCRVYILQWVPIWRYKRVDKRYKRVDKRYKRVDKR